MEKMTAVRASAEQYLNHNVSQEVEIVKSILTRVAAIAALSALVAGAAFAAPPKHPMKKHPMKMAMHMKCPFCGMSLSTKKTAKMNTPIMMHGKMYYTCAECKEKIAAHHMAPKGKMMGHMKGHMKGKM